jgi:hypothetical protein
MNIGRGGKRDGKDRTEEEKIDCEEKRRGREGEEEYSIRYNII